MEIAPRKPQITQAMISNMEAGIRSINHGFQ
jgi:hypothetical protein